MSAEAIKVVVTLCMATHTMADKLDPVSQVSCTLIYCSTLGSVTHSENLLNSWNRNSYRFVLTALRKLAVSPSVRRT